jgi:hypothetical protein
MKYVRDKRRLHASKGLPTSIGFQRRATTARRRDDRGNFALTKTGRFQPLNSALSCTLFA